MLGGCLFRLTDNAPIRHLPNRFGNNRNKSNIPLHIFRRKTTATQGRRTKIGQGGGRIILACAREIFPPERFFPLLGMILAPLWAYFFNFSLYIVRMAKSSGGGEFPPPEKLSEGNFPFSPPPMLPIIYRETADIALVYLNVIL